jgi:hypothetical protein
MRKTAWLVCSLVVAGSLQVQAIDREARMIDRVNLDLSYLDDVDGIGGSVLGETALATRWQEWAVLFGGGIGTLSPLEGENSDYWNLLLGLKLYATPVTSLSAYGKYEQYDSGSTDRDAKSATALLKQRLVPAEFSVCPFLTGAVTVRDRSTFTDRGTESSFSEYLVNAGGGCEFAMNDELSFEFAASYQFADTSDDGAEDLDGWTATVGMLYYWH